MAIQNSYRTLTDRERVEIWRKREEQKRLQERRAANIAARRTAIAERIAARKAAEEPDAEPQPVQLSLFG